jgi:uncharacterized protein involved in exopolysaccharide biosynthesis
MKDSKTSTGFSEFEGPLPAARENDIVFSSEPEAQLEIEERESRERTVARLRLLWEHRRFLERVVGLALVFSTIIAFLIPNRYQSSARLMPPDNESGSGLAVAAALAGGSGTGAALGGLGGIAGQLLGIKGTSDLLVGVMSSRTVADDLIRKFELKKVYRDSRMEDTRKDLASRTEIQVDRKSQIVTVAVTDKDPHRAMAMTQEYVDELNRLLAEVSTSSARRERIFLETRLKAVNQDLESAEKQFSQFASKNTAIDIGEQGKAMVEAGAVLQGQLIAARSELEGLKQIYANSNVRVRSMEARVTELESQLSKISGGDESGSNQGSGQSDSLYPSIRKLPLLGVTWADLYRQTKVQEAVFQMLTQEYEMAKVQEAKEIPTIKVLDAPNLPDKKSFPPHTLIILMGMFFSFVCAVACVFGRNRWNATDPADPRKVLALEVFNTAKAALPWHSRNGFKHSSGSEMGGPKSE